MGRCGQQLILFICTGNVFRSLTAEYAVRRAFGSEVLFRVASAGFEGGMHGVWPEVAQYLLTRGLDVSPHVARRISRELLDEAALVVAMGRDHQELLAEQYELQAPLYLEVSTGTPDTIPDVCEVIPDWRNNLEEARRYAASVMDCIITAAPAFVRAVEQMDLTEER